MYTRLDSKQSINLFRDEFEYKVKHEFNAGAFAAQISMGIRGEKLLSSFL